MTGPFLLSAQFALFLQNTLSRPDRYAYQLYEKIESFRNVIPEISPTSPANTPSAFISNADDNCKMGVTNKRIDLYYQNNLKGVEPTFYKFKEIARTIIHEINLECIRIGIITTTIYPDIQANEFLCKRICIEGALDIQLSYNMKFDFNNKEFNKVYRLYPGLINIANKEYKGLIIERDINNIPTEQTLSRDSIEQIFDKFFNPKADPED